MSEIAAKVEMILIDEIFVANPRVRNAKTHQVITDSIEKVGLKRPITVRPLSTPHDGFSFALVCGQGRLESCKMLGQREIAAIVVVVDEEVGHVMSIVENVARRTPRTGETLHQVRALRLRGYSDTEIAEKIGCTPGWANNVANLLERGEERLLAATEAGHIPLHLAVSISRANDSEAQQLLIDAYESGDLKGKKVTIVRKILERRLHSGKAVNTSFIKGDAPRRHMTSEDLAELYQRDTAKHRLIQKKAEHTQNSLLLAQQIFKELFSIEEFRSLLKNEELSTVPQPLSDLLHGHAFQ